MFKHCFGVLESPIKCHLLGVGILIFGQTIFFYLGGGGVLTN